MAAAVALEARPAPPAPSLLRRELSDGGKALFLEALSFGAPRAPALPEPSPSPPLEETLGALPPALCAWRPWLTVVGFGGRASLGALGATCTAAAARARRLLAPTTPLEAWRPLLLEALDAARDAMDDDDADGGAAAREALEARERAAAECRLLWFWGTVGDAATAALDAANAASPALVAALIDGAVVFLRALDVVGVLAAACWEPPSYRRFADAAHRSQKLGASAAAARERDWARGVAHVYTQVHTTEHRRFERTMTFARPMRFARLEGQQHGGPGGYFDPFGTAHPGESVEFGDTWAGANDGRGPTRLRFHEGAPAYLVVRAGAGALDIDDLRRHLLNAGSLRHWSDEVYDSLCARAGRRRPVAAGTPAAGVRGLRPPPAPPPEAPEVPPDAIVREALRDGEADLRRLGRRFNAARNHVIVRVARGDDPSAPALLGRRRGGPDRKEAPRTETLVDDDAVRALLALLGTRAVDPRALLRFARVSASADAASTAILEATVTWRVFKWDRREILGGVQYEWRDQYEWLARPLRPPDAYDVRGQPLHLGAFSRAAAASDAPTMLLRVGRATAEDVAAARCGRRDGSSTLALRPPSVDDFKSGWRHLLDDGAGVDVAATFGARLLPTGHCGCVVVLERELLRHVRGEPVCARCVEQVGAWELERAREVERAQAAKEHKKATQKAKKPAKMNKSNSGHGRGKRRSA